LSPTALLLWCQRTTEGFPDLGYEIKNFTTCWQSGLAFCAIIVRFKPKLMSGSPLLLHSFFFFFSWNWGEFDFCKRTQAKS